MVRRMLEEASLPLQGDDLDSYGRGWKMILLIFGVMFRFQLLVSGGRKILFEMGGKKNGKP